MTQQFVVYYRVSTDKQGQSGLGLEAQQVAIAHWLGRRVPMASYQEIESGKNSRRPELQKAVNHARREGAVLVVAKLDRLARNVVFVAMLMESGVEFVCCDMPTATRLTLHIHAAVAEDEARRISERTKAALAALKIRGVQLGCHAPTCKLDFEARSRGGKRGGRQNLGRRKWRDPEAVRLICESREAGLGYRRIVELLDSAGHRGWHPMSVRQVWRERGGSTIPAGS